MKKYNFHSHTYRCGHAKGEDEEYIVNAIDANYSYFGVSDHVMFPHITQKGIRGNFHEQFNDYVTSFQKSKKKYEGQIELHLGMEAEYQKGLEGY